ncbi:MAG: methyltransferase domain-containing protein [Thermoproteales archaeon]|nr:methyltransferase domain-containing protein [Thermoproteales archaeon]
MEKEWFRKFFDRYYYETYKVYEPEDRNKRESEFIVKALGLNKGSKILDVGCGYARHAVYLAKFGYNVVGIDLSSFLLEKARERCRKFGVELELIKVDMRNMEFENEFDGAFLFYTTYGYFSDEENFKVLENVHRALKQNGRILIDIWNKTYTYAKFYNARSKIIRTWYYAGEYLVLEEIELDLMNDRLNSKRIFFKGSRQVETKTFSVRLYSLKEINDMFTKIGFDILKIYGNYREEEYNVNSPKLIVIAQKTR